MDQTIELWKTIDGYTSYQISNMGNVRNVSTNCLIKQKLVGNYQGVSILNDNDDKQHRLIIPYLVANAFVENDDLINKHKVDHINNIKTDNRDCNLIWVTQIGEMHNRIEGEKWKVITNYPKYEILNLGRIKVIKSGQIMKDQIKGGYHTIKIVSANNKTRRFFTYVLVALHFIQNNDPESKIEVDHIDSNTHNNSATNLRWVTSSENKRNRFDNFHVYKSKPIIQYDLNYNKIKEWSDIKDILEANPTYKYSNLMRKLTDYRKSYGFYWKYKEKIKEIKFEDDEIFKRIGKFDNFDLSNYAVSNHGKVMNISRETLLSPVSQHGYMHVLLYPKKRKNFRINRLVAFAFVKGRTKKKNTVNHLNKNKLDDRSSNLEWTTVRANTIHAIGKAVQQIDFETGKVLKTFKTILNACKYIGREPSSMISRCCKDNTKTYCGFKWKYVQ